MAEHSILDIIKRKRAEWEIEKNHSSTLFYDGKVRACIEILTEAKPCVWTKGDDTSDETTCFLTGCGKDFELNWGTLTECKMKFCPYCGAEIEEAGE